MARNRFEFDKRLALVQLLYQAFAAGIPGEASSLLTEDFVAEMQPFDSAMQWNGLFEGPKAFLEQWLIPFCHSLDRSSMTCQAHVSQRGTVHVLVEACLLKNKRRIACHQQWTVESNKLAHLHSFILIFPINQKLEKRRKRLRWHIELRHPKRR